MRIILLFFGDYAQKYALYKRRFNGGICFKCSLHGLIHYQNLNAILCSPFFLSVVMPHLRLFLLVTTTALSYFLLSAPHEHLYSSAAVYEYCCSNLKRVYEYCCSSLKRRTGIFGGKQRKNKPTISL